MLKLTINSIDGSIEYILVCYNDDINKIYTTFNTSPFNPEDAKLFSWKSSPTKKLTFWVWKTVY